MNPHGTSNLIYSAQGRPLNTVKSFFEKAANEILLIAPYVQTETLKSLQLNEKLNITIVTTLKLRDLVSGASDIDLFPYAKSNSIHAFYNNRVHLKAYIRDWKDCILGSSNISARGMGTSSNHNYELNCLVEDLDIDSLCYLRKILHDSVRITDDIYDLVKERVDSIPKPEEVEDLELPLTDGHNDFLISALPMSRSIERLFELGNSQFSTDDLEEKNCAIHDTILFDIIYNAGFEQFKLELREKFFSSQFVSDLLDFIGNQGRYFGEVKEWIQLKCQDVPVPSRRDLTGNIQVLYRWIVDLSDGEYLVDRPNYSERIFKAG